MNKNQTVKEVLGTKFGDESITGVLNRINQAYRDRTPVEKLDVDLKGILKEEGISSTRDSVKPGYFFAPPRIIVARD